MLTAAGAASKLDLVSRVDNRQPQSLKSAIRANFDVKNQLPTSMSGGKSDETIGRSVHDPLLPMVVDDESHQVLATGVSFSGVLLSRHDVVELQMIDSPVAH